MYCVCVSASDLDGSVCFEEHQRHGHAHYVRSPDLVTPSSSPQNTQHIHVLHQTRKEEEGGMRGIAFAYDPDRYWVELIDRQATFAGIAENY